MRLFVALAFGAASAAALGSAFMISPGAAVAAEAATPFDKAQATEVVEKLATSLQENFVFPDKGEAYAAMLRAKLASGAYSDFADAKAFAKQVTSDLQAVHKDGHLALHVVPPEDRGGPNAHRGPGGPPPGSSITRSGWLAPGVAYIDFNLFPGNEATLADLRRFIEAHKDAHALIIDARAHRGGGLAEMDVLFPELFAKPAVLVAMDTRQAVDEAEGNPAQSARLRKIAGPKGVVRREHYVTPAETPTGLSRAKVYLLTSKKTGSAGEHLTLALKRTKRATVIGEATYGAGHYGGMIPMDPKFTYAAFIPVGRTFDPDTGEGWEGTGVKPDVEVPAAQALDEAVRRAGLKMTGEAALAALK